MLPNQDFKELFAELNAHDVEFLVVGAHALAAHGHVRATKDLDVWVPPDQKTRLAFSVRRVHSARPRRW